MDHINIIIGTRIKEARHERDFSREQVARKINVTQQQVERYESGVNSISPAKLYMIAKILRKEISWFFETIENKE